MDEFKESKENEIKGGADKPEEPAIKLTLDGVEKRDSFEKAATPATPEKPAAPATPEKHDSAEKPAAAVAPEKHDNAENPAAPSAPEKRSATENPAAPVAHEKRDTMEITNISTDAEGHATGFSVKNPDLPDGNAPKAKDPWTGTAASTGATGANAFDKGSNAGTTGANAFDGASNAGTTGANAFDGASGTGATGANAFDGGNGTGTTGTGSAGGYGYSDGAFVQQRPVETRSGRNRSKALNISKAAFILIIIAAMMISMVLSTLASMLYTNSINGGSKEATDYTLTSSDETLSYKSIIQKTQDSVVSITTESVTNDIWAQNYVTQGAGSGVIITKNGYIITCEHVIESASKIKVTLNNKKEYEADVVGMDVNNDIAVIKIDATGLTPATYGDSSKLEVGDQVVAIGNPLGSLSGTATTGIISALNRNLNIDNRTLNLFQTDASINPGNSGGGMFDAAGNLIGIVEAKSTGSDIDGLGFATPINKAAKIAKEIIEKGGDISSRKGNSNATQIKTVIIGIMVGEIDEQSAKEFGYSHGGLLVRSVTSDEAKKAGLETGDIIYKAGGKTITTQDDLTNVMSKMKAGDKLKLSVARENGKTYDITTKLISSRNDY